MPVFFKEKITQRDSFFLQKKTNDVMVKTVFNHLSLPMSNENESIDESILYSLHKFFNTFIKKFIFSKFKRNIYN